jgi:hypothetical protein
LDYITRKEEEKEQHASAWTHCNFYMGISLLFAGVICASAQGF